LVRRLGRIIIALMIARNSIPLMPQHDTCPGGIVPCRTPCRSDRASAAAAETGI
jgi:hypothetical protein